MQRTSNRLSAVEARSLRAARITVALLGLVALAACLLAGCTTPRLHRAPLRPLLCAQGWPLHGPHHHPAVGRGRPTHHRGHR